MDAKKQSGFTIFEVFVAIFVLLAVGGYIANIVKLAAVLDTITGKVILRIIGVFLMPLGSVMGFI